MIYTYSTLCTVSATLPLIGVCACVRTIKGASSECFVRGLSGDTFTFTLHSLLLLAAKKKISGAHPCAVDMFGVQVDICVLCPGEN